MERIDCYDDLADLVSDHLHRGVRTNTVVTEADYGPAVQAGALWVHIGPAGLLLLRDRGDHTRLNFYLNDLCAPLDLPLATPVVTEVAFRPRDTGLQETVPYLQTQGFSPVLERVRLTRLAAETEPPLFPLYTAVPEDASQVLAFLQENFSPLTGCLPTQEELTADLAQGQVLVLTDCGCIGGLLHFSSERREIRHLAIREDLRGRGFTRFLLQGFLHTVRGAKSVVWVRRDDPAAQGAYHAMGFAPDGWRSTVLCCHTKERNLT